MLTDYFAINTVFVKDYNETVKYNAFIAQMNYLLKDSNATYIVKSVIHRPGYNPSTFEITIQKGSTITTSGFSFQASSN